MKNCFRIIAIFIIISVVMSGCASQKNSTSQTTAANQASITNKIQQSGSTTIKTNKPEAAKSDDFYIEEVVSNYEKLLVEAINNNDFSLIESVLVQNSNLYNSQKRLVPNLYSKNIKEKLINFDIKNIQNSDQSGCYKVYVSENIGVKYPDRQEFEPKEYNWVYTVIKNNKSVGLSDIEKWKK